VGSTDPKWVLPLANLASARIARPTGKFLRFLVALPSVRDLLLWAKHLFVEAMNGNYPRRGGVNGE
jgi:hypothetical protein